MIWALQVFLSCWFGYEVVTFFSHKHFVLLYRVFAGIPIGLFCYGWIEFLLSAKHQLNQSLGFIPVVIFSASGWALSAVNRKRKENMRVRMSSFQLMVHGISCGIFILLMHLSMLNRNVATKGAGYGDLPFHLNIVSSFASGCNNVRNGVYDVNSVFYAGEKLAYPMMTNFITGALMATGKATLRAALFFPSALIAVSLVIAMYVLAYEFSRCHITSALSLVLFVNLGGLGWIKLIWNDHGYGDWVHNWGKNQFEYWFHPLMHILIPQRASLWSMPLCYWTILCLIHGIEKSDFKMFILAGIYVGFMPLVQVHSYVAVAQWAIAYCLIHFPYKKLREKRWKGVLKYVGKWAVFAVVANVMALPQLYPFMNRLSSAKSQFVQLNPIWNTNEKKNMKFAPLVLWWRGLGIFWALSFIGIVLLNKRQIKTYIPSIVVYLITNFVRYQPWELDNTKLFYAAWIPLALPVVAGYLYRLGSKDVLFMCIALVLGFSACLSSFVHTLDCLVSISEIFGNHDIEFGQWVAENTDTKAIFLTSTWHAHPCATIAGRQLYMGYGGWVVSHGLEYWNRSNENGRMSSDPIRLASFTANNISYVISHNNEFEAFSNKTARTDKWNVVFDNRDYRVWKLNDRNVRLKI